MSGGAGHATIFEVGLETKTITTPPKEVTPDLTNRLEEIPVELEVLATNMQCLEVRQQIHIRNLNFYGSRSDLGLNP